MKKIKVLILVMVIGICSNSITKALAAETFTERQQERIDRIYTVCRENWETYGVLPSVCLAQAFVESTMGEYCTGNNLWGIKEGKAKYESIEEGTLSYLKVINNGNYPNAPFCTDAHEQLRLILDGNYCVPEGDYYSDALWALQNYNLESYDERMFSEIEKEKKAKRKAKRKNRKKSQLVYDPTIPEDEIIVPIEMKAEGEIIIYADNICIGTYIISTTKSSNEYFYINDPKLDGKLVDYTVKRFPKVLPKLLRELVDLL